MESHRLCRAKIDLRISTMVFNLIGETLELAIENKTTIKVQGCQISAITNEVFSTQIIIDRIITFQQVKYSLNYLYINKLYLISASRESTIIYQNPDISAY
ncbi:MAG: hypothetical protein ACI9UR_001696 [Bacteroidia bacterium]|jgi:hypothetical protein